MRRLTKNIIATIIVTILLAVAFILSIVNFRNKLNSVLEYDTYRLLSQTATMEKDTIHSTINANFDFLRVLAAQFSSWGDLRTGDIRSSLNDAINTSDFADFHITNVKGWAYASDGTSINIWERKYFQSALLGHETISEPINSLTSGQRCVAMAVPIYINEGTIGGVLTGLYAVDQFESLLSTDVERTGSVSFIVSSDGSLISKAHCSHFKIDYDNISKFFDNATLLDTTDHPENSDDISGTGFVLFEKDNFRHYVTYKPIGINGWSIFTMVPTDFIDSQAGEINTLLISFTITLCLVFIILLGYLFISNNLNNKTIKNQNVAVRSAKLEMDAIINNIPSGIFKYSATDTGEFDFVSNGVANIWGYSAHEYRSAFDNSFYRTIHPSDLGKVKDAVNSAIDSLGSYSVQYRTTDRHHKLRWVYCEGKVALDEANNGWIYASINDITGITKKEQALIQSEQRYRILVEQSDNVQFDYDINKKVILHSKNFGDKFGRIPPSDNFPQSAIDSGYIYYNDCKAVLDLFSFYNYKPDDIRTAEFRLIDGNNTIRWVKATVSAILNEVGEPVKAIGKLTDIDKRKREMEMLTEMASTDQLTGLINKVSATRMIGDYLSYEHRSHCALVAIDLDGFKQVNDTFGHIAGDNVLTEFANILKSSFRSSDIVSRFGGDEFTILIKNVSDIGFVCRVSQRIINEITNKNFGTSRQPTKVSASIGICFIDSNPMGFLTAYHNADTALYNAKAAGKSCYVVYSEQEEDISEE